MQNGCKICDKYKEHYYKGHLNGKGMQFYELMHGDFSLHLRIPKNFTDYCNRELSEIVDLKSPNGKIWHVGLSRTNDEVMLKSGWKEFVEAHNLQESNLLVFKYNGNSCFEISIFDETHCRKEPFHLFMGNNSKKRARSENSMEILKVKSYRKVPFSTTRNIFRENEKSASDYQRTESTCKRRVFISNELLAHPKNKHCNTRLDVGAHGRRYNIKQESDGTHNLGKLGYSNVYMSRRKPLTDEEEKQASQVVHSVQSNNPCFLSFLQYGSVSNQYFACIPTGFSEAHLPSKRCAIILQVPGLRNKWQANLYACNSTKKFCWKSFVIDNGLKVGDACLFELVNCSRDILMTVHILRAAGQEV